MPDEDIGTTSPPSDTPTDDENGLMVMQKETPKIMEVKCGPLMGKMHSELFLCPGIHQPCIELNGEMISPKEFTVRANKDKQKDWKGSIRIGKSNLRTLMEMRSVDFHNHSQLCSAKCQSRNYITPKEKDSESRRGSTASLKNSSPLSSLFGNHLLGQAQCNLDIFKEARTFSQLMQLTSALNNNNQSMEEPKIKAEPTTDDMIDVDDSLADRSTDSRSPEQQLASMNSDPVSFWSEMQDMGVMDDVVDQMVQSLYRAREQARMGNVASVASSLSRVATSLNMNDVLCTVINGKKLHEKFQSHLDKPRLSSDFSCLEDSDPRKRSLDASSHSTPSQSSPPVKRPRVQYPMNMLQQSEQPGMDSKLMQALVQAQMQISQQAPMDLLLQLTNPAASYAENLLAMKRE